MKHTNSDTSFAVLTAAEEDIMNALWNCGGSAGFYELQQAIPGDRRAASTIVNLLYKLEEKGCISIKKQGLRNNRYKALIFKQDYLLAQSRRFLARYWHQSPSGLTSALLPGCSDEELERLHLALEHEIARRFGGEDDLYDPWNG